MPDDEGYLLPGEIGVGQYAGGEMDLGEPLRPLAGFGRDLEELEEDDDVPLEYGWSTAPGGLRYISPDQLESWEAVIGWRTTEI